MGRGHFLHLPLSLYNSDSCVVVYRHVGRNVRAAGGVSIDTAQPVGGVTLRLRLMPVMET